MLARRRQEGSFFEDPFSGFGSLFGDFPLFPSPTGRLGRIFSESPRGERGFMAGGVSVTEENGESVVSISLPGIDPATLDLEVHPEQVSVRTKETAESLHGKISATVAFTRPVDPDKARAESKFGILRISAPFAGSAGRRLEITCDEKGALETPKEKESE